MGCAACRSRGAAEGGPRRPLGPVPCTLHPVLSGGLWAQDFYEDVFEELAKFGEVENLNICDNIADHMVGSVYVKFVDENAAAMALQVRKGLRPTAQAGGASILAAGMRSTRGEA